MLINKYESPVETKIQRVLDRLDSGERLTARRLRIGNSFCVMGLFADESGYGNWWADHARKWRYQIRTAPYETELCPTLVKHYNLFNKYGKFDPDKISAESKDIIDNVISCGGYTLMNVNDDSMYCDYNPKLLNELLADIIRSGAIFKPEQE